MLHRRNSKPDNGECLFIYPAHPSIVVWKIKVQELPGIDVHGKNSANWIISLIIYSAAFYGVINLISALGVVVNLLVQVQMALGAVGIILPIIAGKKASNGEVWKNPLDICILK